MKKMLYTLVRDTHYEWARSVLTSRNFDWPARLLIAVCTVLCGIALGLLMWAPGGLTDTAGRTAGISAVLSDLLVAMLWLRGPWPSRRASFLFIIWSHVGTTATLVFCADWNIALWTTLLLVVTGVYITMMHNGAVLMMHLASMTLVATTFAALSVLSEPSKWASTLSSWLTVLIIASIASVAIRNPWVSVFTFAQGTLYDPLTGVLNRYGLQLHEIKTPHSGEAFAVAVVDIDSFKAINDSYGHLAGDKVLTQFSARLRFLPGTYSHFVVRIGGDEFVVVALIEVGTEVELARKMVESASDTETGPSISASVGLVSWGADYFDRTITEEMLWEFVNEADRLMYEAKRAGGNSFRTDTHP